MIVGWIFGAVALVVAVFFVAWYFYIHDHAARTSGGVEASLSRELGGGTEVTCHDRGKGWRCSAQTASSGRAFFDVVPRGKKNCWRAEGRDITGCVKVLDYVQGLL